MLQKPQVRRDLVPMGGRIDELAALDLSEEPERVLGLIEEIEQLAARVAALRAAARLPPAPGHRAGRSAAPSMSVSAPADVGSTAAPEKSRTA